MTALAMGCGGAAGPAGGHRASPARPPTSEPVRTAAAPTAPAPATTTPVSTAAPPAVEPSFPKVKLPVFVAAVGQIERLDHFDNSIAMWVPVGAHVFAERELAVERKGVIDTVSGTKIYPLGFVEPTLYGSWPDDAWMSGVRATARSGHPEILRYTPRGWKYVHSVRFGWGFAGVGRWSKKRMLALEYSAGYYGDKPAANFRVLSGPRGGKLPQVTRPPMPASPVDADGDGKAEPHEQPPPWIVVPNRMVATTTGHVFVFGDKQDESERNLVEWWAPDAVKSTIEKLPYGPIAKNARGPFATAGTRGDDLYVTQYNQLLRFDGNTWSRVALPLPGQPIDSMSLSQEGTLWVVQYAMGRHSRVFRKARQGGWQQLEFDELVRPAYVYARTDQDVWVTGKLKDDEELTTVFHTIAPPTKPPRFVVTGGDDDIVRQRPGVSLRLPKPATPRCERLFAVFYGITKYAAPGYDFPLTRKALKGHTEFAQARFVKTEERGQQYFGAFIRNYGRAGALITLIEKEVPNSKPQLLCHTPKVLEELDFDLATGNAKGWKAFIPPEGWTEYAAPR